MNWRDNYWGSNVVFWFNPTACFGTGQNAAGKLAYTPLSGSPPNGPISSGLYVGGQSICGYDSVDIGSTMFSTTPYDNSPSSVDYGAGYYVRYYTYDDGLCTAGHEVNPVNAIFYGPSADVAVAHVTDHTGWGDVILWDTQYFFTGSSCDATQEERGSARGISTRYHMRLRQTTTSDPVLGLTTAGTPHHEDAIYWQPDIPCHAIDKGGGDTGLISGFDQGRNQLESALASTNHRWYRRNIGNTQTFVQCDGDPAAADGYTDFFYTP